MHSEVFNRMKLEFKRKDGINTHAIECRDEGPVPYLYFPLLERTGAVRHGFSTKLGGVSRGEFATLNFLSLIHNLDVYKRQGYRAGHPVRCAADRGQRCVCG